MKISFCIPTYNRVKYLEELLDSIHNQIGHSLEIEVCISDNASTDNTSEAVDLWREKYNFVIMYHRYNDNVGPDKNYISAVNMGSGDYCWIFGSDDILAYNSLLLMEKQLTHKSDIYLCDRRELNLSMTEVTNIHRKWLCCGTQFFDFKTEEDLVSYFNSCNSVGGVFSYLSSIVVKKKQWNSIKFDPSYIGTAYSHVYVLLNIINKLNVTLQYISIPLVDCRGENDTFELNGKARRIKIDFLGYLKLQKDLYHSNSNVANAFGKIILRERPWVYTSLAIACYGNQSDKRELAEYYNKLGYKTYFTNLLFLLGRLANVVKNINFLRKIMRKIYFK